MPFGMPTGEGDGVGTVGTGVTVGGVAVAGGYVAVGGTSVAAIGAGVLVASAGRSPLDEKDSLPSLCRDMPPSTVAVELDGLSGVRTAARPPGEAAARVQAVRRTTSPTER